LETKTSKENELADKLANKKVLFNMKWKSKKIILFSTDNARKQHFERTINTRNHANSRIQVRIVGMSRKPQKYRLFAQRLPEKAAENSQKNSHSGKSRFWSG
jgi:hypothetical protein